jgi:hypothetical protein
MAKNQLSEADASRLLGEIEEIIRATPHRDVIGRENDESMIWLGRLVAAVGNWDPVVGVAAAGAVDLANDASAFRSQQGVMKLKALLRMAQADLRFNVVGPVNAAIGKGRPFEYFDEIRKIIGLAKQEVWFVDPYLNANFVSKYLTQSSDGVSVRLLGRKYMAELVPAVEAFSKQEKRAAEVRSSADHHDRFVFIDGAACYQSGASFKDGAENAVTIITQITDAFVELKAKYETLWAAAKLEFKS